VISGDRVQLAATMRKLAIVGGILLFVTFLGYAIIVRPDMSTLKTFGYPGVTILMFFSSGSIFLPAPGFAAVLAAAPTLSLNPVLVGLFAGIGAATGELAGYLVGSGGKKILALNERPRWRRAHQWLQHHGFMAILVFALIPNPFFDVIGILAGSLSYPVRRFWLACLIGNCVKYTTVAVLGASAVTWWLGR
jgi:membrane protein DedA with SNARE-associated domain